MATEEPVEKASTQVVKRKKRKRVTSQVDGGQPPLKKKRKRLLTDGSTVAKLPSPRSLGTPDKLTGWKWWKSIGSPRHVMSPMVGQSELAFRKLCRQHGTNLCYTPMFIAKAFASSAGYRRRLFQTCPSDRPLIAQFCGNDPRALVQAGLLVQDQVDAVDLNLGCPQTVAQRGNYGSWLMDKDWGLLHEIVSSMAKTLKVPVTVKIRRFDDVEKTVAYAKMLQDAGASLITLHARQRHEKEEVFADWSQTARVKRELNIPVVGNGDVYHAEDVWLFQRQTGVDGVMCAQGLLYSPALFEPLVQKGLENGPTREHLKAQRTPDVKVNAKVLLPPYMRRRRQLSAFMTFRITGAWKRQPLGQLGTEPVKNAALAASDDLVLPGSSSAFMSTPQDVEKQFALATEYVRCCFDSKGKMHPAITPCHPSVIRRHIFFILFDPFQANCDLIDELGTAGGVPDDETSRGKNGTKEGALSAKGGPASAKEKWKAGKKQKERIFTDTATGERHSLGMRYFRDSSSRPYLDVIEKLRERAERGSPHPDALAAVDNLKANGNPRTRRRDGTFGPPDWPEGGGGFHVVGRDCAKGSNEAETQKAPAMVEAPPTARTTIHPSQRKLPEHPGFRSPALVMGGTGEKRKLSKAERKRGRPADDAKASAAKPVAEAVVSACHGASADPAREGEQRKLSKSERKQLKFAKK